MNMASAAARYSPTESAAITATHSARSAEIVFLEQRGDGVVEGLVAGQQRDEDGRVDAEDGLEDAQ